MKILNRYTAAVLWDSPCTTMKATVVKAVESGADLRDANLCGADLCGANLRDADLCGANLCGADLCGANLRDADLRGADLCGANLCDANLCGADLCGANLCGADLCDANLRGADLCDANLSSVRADFLAEVLKLPNELDFLRLAIVEGRVDGSTYSGECACLAGTLAHGRGIANYDGDDITNGCTFVADSSSPRERFFLAISKGDTPETNGASKIALQWTDEAIAIRDNILHACKPVTQQP